MEHLETFRVVTVEEGVAPGTSRREEGVLLDTEDAQYSQPHSKEQSRPDVNSFTTGGCPGGWRHICQRQRPGVQTPREMRVKTKRGEFPGGTLVKILCFHYRGHRFDPWSENQDPTCPALQQNEREKKKKDQGGRHKPEREGQRPRREDSKAQ